MAWKCLVRNQRGLTVVELLIAGVIASAVALASFEFYQRQHELYLAQADIVDRQGNLRFAVDEVTRNVRRAGYRVTGGNTFRTSANFDTLEVYIGNDTNLAVDTVRYYVNHNDDPASLIRQYNKTTPAIYAVGVDSASFVPAGGPPANRIAIMLVSVEQKQYENSALQTRRRLGETVNLRNR